MSLVRHSWEGGGLGFYLERGEVLGHRGLAVSVGFVGRESMGKGSVVHVEFMVWGFGLRVLGLGFGPCRVWSAGLRLEVRV